VDFIDLTVIFSLNIPFKYPNLSHSNSSKVINGQTWIYFSGQMVQHQLHDVQQIQSAEHAFAAIRSDGRVVTWGNGPSAMVKTASTVYFEGGKPCPKP
jgi:succinyl-CoA synthetase beta subunit